MLIIILCVLAFSLSFVGLAFDVGLATFVGFLTTLALVLTMPFIALNEFLLKRKEKKRKNAPLTVRK